MENICCIIVTYNIGKNLEKCFFSIKDQVDKVVIVDNGSNSETIDYLNKIQKEYDIELILNHSNMGIAFALNQGVRYALENNYKWILTMDNDSEATKNMIKTMLSIYNNIEDNEKRSIVGMFPKYIEKGLYKTCDEESTLSNNSYKYIISDMTSGNLLKSSVFTDVGFFKEDLFIDYVDHEFCYRINTKGFKLIKLEDAKLLHRLGNTKSKKILFKDITYTNHSEVRRYYITRNRFYTWKNFKKLKEPIKIDKINFVKENLKIILLEKNKIKKFKMIFKGYLDYKKNKFGKIDYYLK